MTHDTSGERTRCFLKATIVFNNRMSSIDCIVRNMSVRGARLEVDGSISIPQEFDLEIPARGAIYRATARWRDVHAIGVDFVEAHAAGRPESAIAAENRELRRQLDAMSRRLREMSEADPA